MESEPAGELMGQRRGGRERMKHMWTIWSNTVTKAGIEVNGRRHLKRTQRIPRRRDSDGNRGRPGIVSK